MKVKLSEYAGSITTRAEHSVNKLKLTPQEFKNNAYKE